MAKKVPKKIVEEIVETKKVDLTAGTKEAGMRTIEGSIRSMGLKLDY
jgi:large subunit ribosomal protein L11